MVYKLIMKLILKIIVILIWINQIAKSIKSKYIISFFLFASGSPTFHNKLLYLGLINSVSWKFFIGHQDRIHWEVLTRIILVASNILSLSLYWMKNFINFKDRTASMSQIEHTVAAPLLEGIISFFMLSWIHLN